MPNIAYPNVRGPSQDTNFPKPFTLLPIETPHLEVFSRHCEMTVDEIEDIYPCTPFQEGLMAITAQQPTAYIAQITLGIPESINISRFKAAWECLVHNCAILRTRIMIDSSGKSIQVVATRCSIHWQDGDCLSSYLQEDLAQSMGYGMPLTRFAIINDQSHGRSLVWTVHHALYDGWTIRLLFDHLSQIYQGAYQSPPPPFSTFVQYLQDTWRSQQTKDFWSLQLAGNNYRSWPEVPPQTQVVADQTIHESFNLLYAGHQEVTAPTLLRSAWAMALGLFASSPNVVFAEVLSGRDIFLPQATEIVGPMLSTVPIALEVDFSLSVGDFLRRIQLHAADIIDYQHAGLQNINRLLLAEGRHLPPLNNMFIVQPPEESGDDASSLGLNAIPDHTTGLGIFDTFPVNVQCVLKQDSVDVQVAFDGSIVTPDIMAQLLAVFVQLSRQLATAKDNLRLTDLNVIPAAHVSQILLHQRKPPLPVRAYIHQIIENRVRDAPQAIALHGFDGKLTYAQLWQASDLIAGVLIDAGVGRGVYVPLCFEKSIWAIVSMMAVLKAGGACVNLDASHPDGRIEKIIQDTQATVVVASSKQRSRLAALASTVIPVDEETIQAMKPRKTSKTVSSQPEDAAFVIYTSGSTGTPKGIVNTHYALVSSAAAHGAVLDIGPKTRAIQFASYAFDSSIQDISTVLQRGGCICVISETDRVSDYPAAVHSVRGNYALLTTSVASLYTPADLPSVRTLQLGGEPMRKSILQAWGEHARVMNTYGPAECSINVTCAADMREDDMESNIGLPVGCRCWVVNPDNANQLLPLACAGELLVEGPILARGYLNDPEKTNSVFIAPPPWRQMLDFDIGPCERLYRTGDMVFQSSNGNFHYVGRKDAQVKLNGQRLEVEEIESLMQQHPSITQAALLLPKAGPYANRLVAIFTLSDGHAEPSDEIRIRQISDDVRTDLVGSLQETLSQSLPASIRVSYFIAIWYLPLTISRKLDRKTIRHWLEMMKTDISNAALDSDTLAAPHGCSPQSPVDMALQNACSHVLNLPTTKINFSRPFFGIGGDSIAAIQVIARLRAEHIAVTVPDLLQVRTLADVAQYATIDNELFCAGDQPDDELFCLSPIQRWYFSVRPPNAGADGYYNQCIYGTLTQSFSESEVRQAITALVQNHSMLRARFRQIDGEWKQAICSMSDDVFVFRAHELTDSAPKILTDLAHTSHTGLDITNGPVFSVDMFKFLDGRQSLLLVAHHLLVDIVSWTVLVDDLNVLLRGEQIRLREQMTFQAWCRLKYENFQSSEVVDERLDEPEYAKEANFEYWGLNSESQVTNESQRVKSVCADPHTTELILGDANRALRTEPVDLLLSAVWIAFFAAFEDRNGLVIYNEGHGRDLKSREIDLSRTVGWFTTLTRLSLSRQSNPDPTSIVQMAKDCRRLAEPHSAEVFACRYLQRGTRRQEQPKEMLFNYQGYLTPAESTGALFQEENPHPFNVKDQGTDFPVSALFEVEVIIVDGEVEYMVYWSEQLRHQRRIVTWIESIPEFLHILATQLMECKLQTYSLTDFPLLALDYARLSRLQNSVLPHIRQHCRAQIEDVFPCSPMQDGLLLAQLKQARNYQTAQEYRVCPTAAGESVDLNRLAAAWKQVVSRHPSLRTVFTEGVDDSSAFSQVVLDDSFGPDIVYVNTPQDLAALPPVDYQQLRPPHRLALALESTGDVVCVLELSHVIVDAASAGNILRDWERAYRNTLQTRQEIQATTYAEFIKYIRSISCEEKLKYWTRYLADIEPCHFPSMPATKPSMQDHTAIRKLNQDESDRIRQFCTHAGITLATLLQAAWSLVLSRYAGTDDVCFGYLASGRDAPVPGMKDAVGAFINMLICRVRLSCQTTALQFVQEVQKQSVEHLKYQHCTLAEIHHALDIPHGQPLFNTIMSFQKEEESVREEGSSLSFLELGGRDPTEYDLSIGITAGRDGIQLSQDYNDRLISPQHGSAILSSFQGALAAIVNKPRQPVRQISLLQEQDFATLIAWNEHFPITEQSCIHEVISAQVACSPAAPAVSSFESDGDLCYEELDDFSSRLAKYLVLAGVQLEQAVPLCFDKSTWAAVSMLAVLKAGGVCVSLGSASPMGILQDTLADTKASIILVAPQHVHLFRDIPVQTLAIDRNFVLNLTRVQEPYSLLPKSKPQNAAFIVYTSGSTGKPKGIVLDHSAVVTSSKAHGSAMGISSTSRVLQFSAYTFDVSIQDIFTTWQRGGCVCIISEHERLNDLTTAINSRQANFADLPPIVVGLIVPSQVPCLETISMGGEVVPQSVNELWRPYVRVINVYGPAETCINAAYTDKGTDEGDHIANLGRPMASWFWVVDSSNSDVLVPIGCVGELIIEGPLLARGYLNNPDKTRAAFITNPKWSKNSPSITPGPFNRRMYKTGDLVRLNSNGTYTYIGRKDRQVKLQGHRIELSEVEHHLRRLVPSNVNVVVEILGASGGKRHARLVAFMEWNSSFADQETNDESIILPVNHEMSRVFSQLRESLNWCLPSYMQPSLFIPLHQFPLTASGKLDRKTLINLVEKMSPSEQNRTVITNPAGERKTAPTTPTQKILHALIIDILALSSEVGADVGMEDSFFALGGDSVHAISLAQQARKRGVCIGVADVLRNPRIEDLAGVVDARCVFDRTG